MKSLIPLIVFVVVVLGLIAFSRRARHRQASAAAEQSDRIRIGSEVMTTSGLYGTVVARNDEESVQLAIAPGVEVKWALAALRDVESLPDRYRGPLEESVEADELDEPGGRVELDRPRGLDAGGAEPAT